MVEKNIDKGSAISFHLDLDTSIEINRRVYSNKDFEGIIEIPQNSDLISGKYEGGIKLWECAIDLLKFLPEYFKNELKLDVPNLKDTRTLELGCGHGFPGLQMLMYGGKVVFQDFNKEVLDIITQSYINDLNNKIEDQKVLGSQYSFADGDWLKMKFEDKFDFILTADTLYNVEYYERLHDLIADSLKTNGRCLIASKKFYFGVGGGTMQFVLFIEKKGLLEQRLLKEINNGFSNIRQIIEVKSKK